METNGILVLMDGKILEHAQALKDACENMDRCYNCPLLNNLCSSDWQVGEPKDWDLDEAYKKYGAK